MKTEEEITRELMEIVPIDLLSEEQRQEAKRISTEQVPVYAVKYINTIINDGLKTAKAYYDLYIDDRTSY